MNDRVTRALENTRKADAEMAAVIFEDACGGNGGNPWVQAEDGHWMSNEEVAQALRDSWRKK